MMPDKGKVIKALECCLKESDHLYNNPCNGCPYEGQECIDRMKADALSLLKWQEHKDKVFHDLENDWKRLKGLLKEQELDIEALKNTIEGMVEGQCIIAGDKRIDVIRCKNCKHSTVLDNGLIKCGHAFRTADFFCADGEKRD